MLVVSDTSPMRALQAIDRLDLIETLFGTALVPPRVAAELQIDVPGLGPLRLSDFPFLVLRAPRDLARVTMFGAELDSGEAEALALALEMRADLVLIDEDQARKIARRLGLKPTGVLAILLESKSRGYCEAVRPLLEQMERRIQFRVAPDLRERVIRLAGEA